MVSIGKHDGCTVLQGGALSFLNCPATFEIFQTEKIAKTAYEQTFYGEIKGIVYAHTTLETNRAERITWADPHIKEVRNTTTN